MPLDVVVALPFDMGNYGKVSNTILAGISNATAAASFGLVAGDEILLQVYPRDKSATVGAATTSHRLQSGYALRVTGKPVNAPGSSTLLFNSTSFTEEQTGSDWHYDGALDLDTDELIAALGSAQSIQVMLVIQITDTTGAVQTFLQPITIFNPYYDGSEGAPTPGTPGYLDEDQIAALYIPQVPAQGSFRMKTEMDGTANLQLWNADTELWHTLYLSGVAGAVQLNLSVGES